MHDYLFNVVPLKPVRGREILIDIENSKATDVFDWSFDSVAIELVHKSKRTLKIRPLLSGSFKITYRSQTESYSIMIDVLSKKPDDDGAQIEIEEEEVSEEIKIEPIRTQDIPSLVKRNARYRGHRESQKFNFSQDEKSFDIRKNYQNIKREKISLDEAIDKWLYGEELTKSDKELITGENVHRVSDKVVFYTISNNMEISYFTDIMVKLDGETLRKNLYTVRGRVLELHLDKLDLEDKEGLIISYTGVSLKRASSTVGLKEIQSNYSYLTEKIEEIERRLINYENAYK